MCVCLFMFVCVCVHAKNFEVDMKAETSSRHEMRLVRNEIMCVGERESSIKTTKKKKKKRVEDRGDREGDRGWANIQCYKRWTGKSVG